MKKIIAVVAAFALVMGATVAIWWKFGRRPTPVELPASESSNTTSSTTSPTQPPPAVGSPDALQLSYSSLGELTEADLIPMGERDMPKGFSADFVTESHMCFRDREENQFQIPIEIGKTRELGKFEFSLMWGQYSRTADGTIWCGRMNEGEVDQGDADLVRFDKTDFSSKAVYTWHMTSGFIRVIGHGDDVYTHRVEGKDLQLCYIIEKYSPAANTMTPLVSMKLEEGIIYTFAIANDHIYALIDENSSAKESHFCLREYDLNGKELRRYDMPDYTDEVVYAYSSPINLAVFDDYVAIVGLQGCTTLFQKQGTTLRRVYFTDKRVETEYDLEEVPYYELIDHAGRKDVPYLFFWLQKDGATKQIVYAKSTKTFYTLDLNIDEKKAWIIGITPDATLLFRSDGNDLYTLPLKDKLP